MDHAWIELVAEGIGQGDMREDKEGGPGARTVDLTDGLTPGRMKVHRNEAKTKTTRRRQ